VLDASDAVVYDSGIVENPTTRSVVLSLPTNNVTRKLQVRVRDTGLYSPYSTSTNPIAFTQPVAPTFVLGTVFGASGQPFGLAVTVTNPAPGTGQPAVTEHEVYVRTAATSPTLDRYRPFGENGTPVHRRLTPGGQWIDGAIASGVVYEYRVVSVATTGASATSGWVSTLGGSSAGSSLYDTALYDSAVYV